MPAAPPVGDRQVFDRCGTAAASPPARRWSAHPPGLALTTGRDRISPPASPMGLTPSRRVVARDGKCREILDKLAVRKLVDAGRYAHLVLVDQPTGALVRAVDRRLGAGTKVRTLRGPSSPRPGAHRARPDKEDMNPTVLYWAPAPSPWSRQSAAPPPRSSFLLWAPRSSFLLRHPGRRSAYGTVTSRRSRPAAPRLRAPRPALGQVRTELLESIVGHRLPGPRWNCHRMRCGHGQKAEVAERSRLSASPCGSDGRVR